ncbi:MAG: sulfite exporter TauE/SafE family protein, partial [Spirulinaceae cyanobacterium RM2_2_10]|nr:sulfite exporter TauE/SafE family protein [Spirulinaceae cyanobacterium RM2_2_10]
GRQWRRLHLLSIPIALLAVTHAVLLGSTYLGSFERSAGNWLAAGFLVSLLLVVQLIRWRAFWSFLSLERFYAAAKN